MPAIKVVLTRGYDYRWRANPYGRSAHILRPVPGNTSPAQPAAWASREDAERELPILLGHPIEVVSVVELA